MVRPSRQGRARRLPGLALLAARHCRLTVGRGVACRWLGARVAPGRQGGGARQEAEAGGGGQRRAELEDHRRRSRLRQAADCRRVCQPDAGSRGWAADGQGAALAHATLRGPCRPTYRCTRPSYRCMRMAARQWPWRMCMCMFHVDCACAWRRGSGPGRCPRFPPLRRETSDGRLEPPTGDLDLEVGDGGPRSAVQVCAPNGEEAPLEIIQTVKANLTNYEFRYETSLCGLHSLHVLLRGVPIQVGAASTLRLTYPRLTRHRRRPPSSLPCTCPPGCDPTLGDATRRPPAPPCRDRPSASTCSPPPRLRQCAAC